LKDLEISKLKADIEKLMSENNSLKYMIPKESY
jgi:hypothetical protein